MSRNVCVGLVLGAATALLSGCAEGPPKPDPAKLAEARVGFVLDSEPADAVTALDWFDAREAVDETAASEDADASAADATRITLVGMVGGMPNPFGADVEPDFPWRAGEATFFVVDPATAAGFADHADEAGDDHAADCPFCAREAASQAKAAVPVLFNGPDGKPLPYDARDLFGLNKGDLVVVTGEWTLAAGMLVVEADGLYPRD